MHASMLNTRPDLLRDRQDYANFLLEYGLTEEWIAAIVHHTDDLIAMPSAVTGIALQPSPIHGVGMFVTRDFAPGETIAPARLNACRTPAGRYVNHAYAPNAVGIARTDGLDADIDLIATRAIVQGEEVVTDYRQACNLNNIGTPSDIAAYRALPRRAQMTNLIADLMANGQRESPPLKHSFCNGMYMRELFIPKGTLIAGVVHKVACLNICSSGDIDILTEHGMLRAGAGFTAVSQPLTQKLGYAYADTVWINVFRTDLLDVAAIEAELFMSEAEMIAYLDPTHRHFAEYLAKELT